MKRVTAAAMAVCHHSCMPVLNSVAMLIDMNSTVSNSMPSTAKRAFHDTKNSATSCLFVCCSVFMSFMSTHSPDRK